MMISPKTYYELYLKGRNEKEINLVIRRLKKEIKQLKLTMESFDYQPNMKPDEATQLWCNRLYLEQAKQTLQSIGGTYIPSKEELKAKEFNDNIPYITKINYHSVSAIEGITIINIEFDDEFATVERSYMHNSKVLTETVFDKEMFLDDLRTLDLGEWKNNYKSASPKDSHMEDGSDWYLDIYYANDIKPFHVKGINVYPYNFNKLIDLLNYDEEDDIDYLEYDIDHEIKNYLINEMLQKIKELPKGSEICTSQLLEMISNKHNYNGHYIYDNIELTFKDMMSLNNELLIIAKHNGIVIDNTIHDGEILGLLFNIGFKIVDY